MFGLENTCRFIGCRCRSTHLQSDVPYILTSIWVEVYFYITSIYLQIASIDFNFNILTSQLSINFNFHCSIYIYISPTIFGLNSLDHHIPTYSWVVAVKSSFFCWLKFHHGWFFSSIWKASLVGGFNPSEKY